MTVTPDQLDTAPLAPLARIIATVIEEVPVRLGSSGTTDLAAALLARVAAYMGRELGPLAAVLGEIAAEREVQDAKFGQQNWPDGTGGPAMRDRADESREQCQWLTANGGPDWRAILLEEVYEALAEEDPARLRAELVQVAAVAAAWVEAIDRRTAAARAEEGRA